MNARRWEWASTYRCKPGQPQSKEEVAGTPTKTHRLLSRLKGQELLPLRPRLATSSLQSSISLKLSSSILQAFKLSLKLGHTPGVRVILEVNSNTAAATWYTGRPLRPVDCKMTSWVKVMSRPLSRLTPMGHGYLLEATLTPLSHSSSPLACVMSLKEDVAVTAAVK